MKSLKVKDVVTTLGEGCIKWPGYATDPEKKTALMEAEAIGHIRPECIKSARKEVDHGAAVAFREGQRTSKGIPKNDVIEISSSDGRRKMKAVKHGGFWFAA